MLQNDFEYLGLSINWCQQNAHEVFTIHKYSIGKIEFDSKIDLEIILEKCPHRQALISMYLYKMNVNMLISDL